MIGREQKQGGHVPLWKVESTKEVEDRRFSFLGSSLFVERLIIIIIRKDGVNFTLYGTFK